MASDYRVKVYGTYLFQDILNVYHYQTLASNGSAGELAGLVDAELIPGIQPLLKDEMVFYRVEVVNELDPDDYADLAITTAGSQTEGDPEPSFVTYTFKFLRPSAGIRHGWKRFAGVADSWISGNGLLTAHDAVAAGVASALAATMIGASESYLPAIRATKFNGVAIPAGYAYYPTGQVTFNGIGTQNTRKARRGRGYYRFVTGGNRNATTPCCRVCGTLLEMGVRVGVEKRPSPALYQEHRADDSERVV